jgi:very-short-patch-repair endonuclease
MVTPTPPTIRAADLRDLARHQHSLATRAQAATFEVGRESLRSQLDRRHWEALTKRVLRLRGSPHTPGQRAMAATLDVDGVLSHTSAAAWWGLPGFSLDPLHVSVERRVNEVSSALATVHRIRALDARYVTVLRQVPVVRPELLVLQLCAVVHPDRAARALDRAWSMRLLSGPSTRRVLDEVATCGVRGVTVLRALLDERGDRYVPPASGLEGRFAEILERAGLPPMDRQVDLGDDEQWCGRVDFRDRVLPLVVEVNSERFHTALLDVQADAARTKRLEAAGLVVVVVDDHQVFHDPRAVVEAVLAGRRVAATRRSRTT